MLDKIARSFVLSKKNDRLLTQEGCHGTDPIEQTLQPLDDEVIEAFAARLRGPVLRPGDDDYDEARTVWNGMIDKRPALIARARAPPTSSRP